MTLVPITAHQHHHITPIEWKYITGNKQDGKIVTKLRCYCGDIVKVSA